MSECVSIFFVRDVVHSKTFEKREHIAHAYESWLVRSKIGTLDIKNGSLMIVTMIFLGYLT